MTIPDTGTLQELQMTEEVHGNHVHDWVAEGMPVEIMGRVRGMEKFRERQAERPPEVPTNIERRNKHSVQRSEKAASETGPSGETGVPDPVRDVISSTGRSLDPSIQRSMEEQMGDSFGDIQIHTGSQAAAACESINARAFTVGNHVAFNSGEYDPSSAEGQHVIAHELAHVRQQTGGAVSMLPQENEELEIDPDPQLEREAEETAQRVMQGGVLGIQRLAQTEVHVQRMDILSLFRGGNSDTTTDGGEGSDGEMNFMAFEGGDLGETIATLIENQQQIIEQLGGQIGEREASGMAEVGVEEGIKALVTAGAAKQMPESPADAAEAVPTSIEEAEAVIRDIAGNSADTIIDLLGSIKNPGELVDIATTVAEQGVGEFLTEIYTASPKIAGGVAVAFIMRYTGPRILKGLKEQSSNIALTIKQELGFGSDSREDNKNVSGKSRGLT